jgi:hypothetical protein
MERFFTQSPNVGLIAENGGFIRAPGAKKKWLALAKNCDFSWREHVERIFNYYAERTPGSSVYPQSTTNPDRGKGNVIDIPLRGRRASERRRAVISLKQILIPDKRENVQTISTTRVPLPSMPFKANSTLSLNLLRSPKLQPVPISTRRSIRPRHSSLSQATTALMKMSLNGPMCLKRTVKSSRL